MPSGSRSGSVQGRKSGEITGITEEDEEEVDEDGEVIEEVDQFGPELGAVITMVEDGPLEEPTTPLSPMHHLMEEHDDFPSMNGEAVNEGGKVPLTAHALAMMMEEEEAKEEKAAVAVQPL